MICAGIDAGSRSIKAVVFDTDRAQVLSSAIADQGVEQRRLAAEVFERALQQAQLERAQVTRVVATGYGRHAVQFADAVITEITCHAHGVFHLAPAARTIIEIGGQDSKVISLDQAGRVRDFAMNDRCAAGTGRFLEMVAMRLGVDWEEFAALSKQCTQPASISNMCAVFAETEIIGLLAQGTPVADVVAGVQTAMATRIATLAGRCVAPPVFVTGGVAQETGLVRALGTALAMPVSVAPQPQFTGALGAAILGCESGR